MGMLLNVVWLLILLLLFRKKEKKVFDKLVMFILLVAETMTLLKTKIPMLFEFEATWGIQNFSRASYYAIATWIVILLTTVLGVFFACEELDKKIVATLLMLASYATTAIMIFSPTMYESGCRVMYHGALLVIILILLLLSELYQRQKDIAAGLLSDVNIAMAIMIGCELYQYVSLCITFASGFKIHLKW